MIVREYTEAKMISNVRDEYSVSRMRTRSRTRRGRQDCFSLTNELMQNVFRTLLMLLFGLEKEEENDESI